MCVYLAPRWRRRSLPLLLSIMALLTVVDGCTLRRHNAGSESAYVSNQKVGVVTTDIHQSTQLVVMRAWNSGSGSWLSDEKSVSFKNLAKTNTIPCSKGNILTDALRDSKHKSNALTKKTNNHNNSGSLGGKAKHQRFGSNAMHNDQLSTALKDRNDENVSSAVPVPAPGSTEAPTAANLMPEPPLEFQAVLIKSPLSDSSEPKDESTLKRQFGSTKSAEALDNDNRASSVTLETKSLDQSIVGVIIIVVGTIAGLLVFASRQVLKEMGDDIDASFF